MAFFKSRAAKISLSALLALTMSASLFAGCAKKGGDTGKNEPAKKDVVTVWTFPVEKDYKDNFAAIKAEFEEKNKNIEIKVEELSWAEGGKKFDTAINAGDPPDIMFTLPQDKYITTGLAVPVEQYLDKAVLDDFYKIGLEYMKKDGKLYGLPLYMKIHTIGGNKKLLEEAGIDYKKIQKDGWTWDEFKTLAKKGSKKTADGKQQYGFVFHGAQTSITELLEHMLINNGLPYQDQFGVDEKGNYTYTDPKFLETLKFITSLIDEGIMPKESNQITPGKRMEMLYAEQAMIVGKALPYYEVTIADNNTKVKEGKAPEGQKEVDFVLLPEPYNKGQKPVTPGGVDGYTLFRQKNYKGDEHTKNAAKVLAALTTGKAGVSAKVLCLPQVTKSGDALFKDKYTMSAENKAVVDMLFKNVQTPVQVNVDQSKKAQQIFDQVIKAKYPALLGKDVTPEDMYKAVKDMSKDLFGK